MSEQLYTEKLIRLQDSFLCYMADRDSPEVGNLPALTAGHITFGSFNNFAKMSHEAIILWAKILQAVPDSHLIMKSLLFFDCESREYALKIFAEKGISDERVNLLPYALSTQTHLNLYNSIDIGLDTFPYNGTTTTCEAMWMGVPVITLAGDAHLSRIGVSLLSNIGLTDLIAKTHDEYVSIAVNLANDLKRVQFLRESLRDTLKYSPLCDAKRFTLNLEKCYHTIWDTWCKSV
jgi:predicted O-linked N-acetylglucosamine transferase (SPINDLY family)